MKNTQIYAYAYACVCSCGASYAQATHMSHRQLFWHIYIYIIYIVPTVPNIDVYIYAISGQACEQIARI